MQDVGVLRFVPYPIISSFLLFHQVELFIDLKLVLSFTLKKRQMDSPCPFYTESSILFSVYKMHQILT